MNTRSRKETNAGDMCSIDRPLHALYYVPIKYSRNTVLIHIYTALSLKIVFNVNGSAIPLL